MDLITFRKSLTEWFENHRRMLPWRENKHWYRVWISESMLQQTQVTQVIPYFERFLRHFPDVNCLASASVEDVLKIWEGLGYYARARNLHKAARMIVSEYNGEIPLSYDRVRDLPGFGNYTCSALLSIAFNQPFSVVDGNVTRVVSRLFGIETDIRLNGTKKQIARHAGELLDQERPGLFNEGMMELGALICIPREPHCQICPVSGNCQAKKLNLTTQIPFKSPASSKPSATVTVYIISSGSRYLLVQRPSSGLLGGLWEFPSILSSSQREFEKKFPTSFTMTGKITRRLPVIRHSFTHFKLQLEPVCFRTSSNKFESGFYPDSRWLDFQDLSFFPMHRSMHKIIQLYRLNQKSYPSDA
jgi:A/G-specific adenine glycosylase